MNRHFKKRNYCRGRIRTIGLLLTMMLCLAKSYFAAAQTPPYFNVRDYGAVGDGATLDSSAVNAAISAAGAVGGGTVTFPPGNYLCGSIHLTNNLTLYLSNNAVIWASALNIDTHESNTYSQYQDQGHSYFRNSLIYGINLTNLTFAGSGKIDGIRNLATGNPSAANPGDKALCLVLCTNITVRDLTITNGGHFGILAQACTNFVMTGANIFEKTSRDGINLVDTSFVVISNCVIEGADDAVCFKSDYALGRKIGAHDIRVTDSQILSTQNNATQIGSETVGDFSNLTFSNLVITGAGKAGIGITSQDGSIIDGLRYDNIVMTNCAAPIFLKLDYRTTDSPNPSVGRIRNVAINNVSAYHSTLFNRTNTSTINGYFNTNTLSEVPIENITFNHVNVSNIGRHSVADVTNYPPENQDWQPQNFGKWPSYGWYVRWANNISFTNCEVHFDFNDDRPAVVVDTATNIVFDHFTADVGVGNTNFDMGFLSVTNFVTNNAIATVNAPNPGAPLRISTQSITNPVSLSPLVFEAEWIPFVTNGATAAIQTDANSSASAWEALQATANGQWIEYTLNNVPAGQYQLALKWKGNTSNRGIIRHAVDGVDLGDSLDMYSSAQTYPETNLAVVTFTNTGNHTVRQTVIGKNPAGTGDRWASADKFTLTLLQSLPSTITGIAPLTNGSVQLDGTGYPNLGYTVQANTNISGTNWFNIGTITADPTGVLQFIDTNAPTQQLQRFYRFVTPQQDF